MDVVDGHRALPAVPAPAVAIGNFDGVHLGHRALLDRAIAHARAAGGTAVALTFDPAPVGDPRAPPGAAR